MIINSRNFLTIDSGLLYFARLTGIKTTSYWGPSNPSLRLEGLNKSNDVIYYDQLVCSPCVHVLPISPCNGNNLCIKQHFEVIDKKEIIWIKS